VSLTNPIVVHQIEVWMIWGQNNMLYPNTAAHACTFAQRASVHYRGQRSMLVRRAQQQFCCHNRHTSSDVIYVSFVIGKLMRDCIERTQNVPSLPTTWCAHEYACEHQRKPDSNWNTKVLHNKIHAACCACASAIWLKLFFLKRSVAPDYISQEWIGFQRLRPSFS